MVYFVGFILLRPQNLIGFAGGIAVYNANRCLSHLETDAYSAAVDSSRKTFTSTVNSKASCSLHELRMIKRLVERGRKTPSGTTEERSFPEKSNSL